MKKKSVYKPRTQKQIQNLSRAINKVPESTYNTLYALEHKVSALQMGFNDITYNIDGKIAKIKYTDIPSLPKSEQASLINQMRSQRNELRDQRAVEILKEKGKLSWQFKRSIEQDNPQLYSDIVNFETLMSDNSKENIKTAFQDVGVTTEEDFRKDFDDTYKLEGSSFLFDFYRPDLKGMGGFQNASSFNLSAFKVMRGMI